MNISIKTRKSSKFGEIPIWTFWLKLVYTRKDLTILVKTWLTLKSLEKLSYNEHSSLSSNLTQNLFWGSSFTPKLKLDSKSTQNRLDSKSYALALFHAVSFPVVLKSMWFCVVPNAVLLDSSLHRTPMQF